MATGYTYPVKEGKITDFKVFALRCARAFGPLIEMRDHPLDAEIPETFEPSGYTRKALEAAKRRVADLEKMTPARIVSGAMKANRDALRYYEDRIVRNRVETDRYRAMLTKVDEWRAPTSDHAPLKAFMREQLIESIALEVYDPPKPKERTPEEWHARALADARRDVEYHTERREAEERLAKERTEWVRALRESL